MPVDYMTCPVQSGEKLKIPFLQYALNPNQQFCVLGINFDDFPANNFVFNEATPWVEVDLLGKLSEQGIIYMHQIQNSLVLDGWDYLRYPDPEIILLTDKSKRDKIIVLN